MNRDRAATHSGVNWGLIGLLGLAVEFWIVLGVVLAEHVS